MSIASTRQRRDSAEYGRAKYSSLIDAPVADPPRRSSARGERTINAGIDRQFYDFIGDPEVKMIGVEAGGRGAKLGEHAARFSGGSPGVLHGTYTFVLQNEDGLISNTHSISAGLDYPAVGPEHAALYRQGRVEYTRVSDEEALEAARVLARTEGIIPALEPAHALAEVLKRAAKMRREEIVVVNLSGRGDKDLGIFQSAGIL